MKYFRLALTALVLASIAIPTHATDTPITHWKFNEGTGTLTTDSSGNGNTASLSNSPSWVTSGLASNAIEFTSGKWVEAPHWSGWNLTNAITLSIWIKPAVAGNGPPSYSLFYNKGGAISSGWGMYLTDLRKILFQMTSQNGNSIATARQLPTNLWSHVALTFDGTEARFYVNGVLDHFATWTGARVTNASAVTIGKVSTQMVLDDARIYDRALSESEIVALYYEFDADLDRSPDANEVLVGSNSGLTDTDGDGFKDGLEVASEHSSTNSADYPPTTENLGGWFKLDEASGTSASDSSTNGNTGTVSGGAVWMS